MDAPQKTICTFCERLVLGFSDAPWDTTIAETEKYVIVPTKGALVSGWLLVVSKRHALCAGALEPAEFAELRRAIDMAQQLVECNFGPATIFEHGPRSSGTSLGCGVDHLHFHVAPLNFSLREAVNSLVPDAEWKGLTDLNLVSTLHDKGIGYAVVHEPGTGIAWFEPPTDIRQPLRRAIANQLGVPERFDYNAHPHLANVLRTLDQITVKV